MEKTFKSLGLILILTITSHSKPPSLFSDSSKCHFLYGLEIGYITEGVVYLYSLTERKDKINYNLTFYTDVSIGFNCFNFYIKGNSKIPMWANKNSFSFTPFAGYFNFSLGYEKNKFNAGIRHMCAHPIVPAMVYIKIPEMMSGGYTEFFIRFGTF